LIGRGGFQGSNTHQSKVFDKYIADCYYISKGVKHMGTILNKRELPVVDELIKLLKSLTQEEQQEINNFIRGVKFAERTAK